MELRLDGIEFDSMQGVTVYNTQAILNEIFVSKNAGVTNSYEIYAIEISVVHQQHLSMSKIDN